MNFNTSQAVGWVYNHSSADVDCGGALPSVLTSIDQGFTNMSERVGRALFLSIHYGDTIRHAVLSGTSSRQACLTPL